MKPKEFLLTAWDAASDLVAAQMAAILRDELSSAEAGYSEEAQPLQASLEPRFYGVGGREMRRMGAGIVCEGTDPDAFKKLYGAALICEPDAIICIGSSAENARLARAVTSYLQKHSGTFFNWEPKLIWVTWSPGGQGKKEPFECVISRQNHEDSTALAGRAAHEIVELMMHELGNFPLKAALHC